VNIIRTEELLATGCATVATACPFCPAMLDLGRKVAGAEERCPSGRERAGRRKSGVMAVRSRSASAREARL